MDVDSSTASTENRHPDGSSTVVTVHPTGEVIRSVHYTAADGHRVSVSSDGAGGQTEIHTYDGGRVYSEIRKADGSTFRSDTHTEPDGTRVNVSQGPDDGFVSTSRTFEKDGVKTIEKTVPPDAHKETWTEELTTLPDGTKMHQVKDFDGTRVNTVEWGTGGEITTTTLPDGTQKQSASWQTEDGWVTRDVDVDGSTTVTQTSTDPVTSWTTTTTTHPDGHQEVRADRTTEKPDGGTVYEHSYPDGHTSTTIFRPDGSSDSMVVFPDGTTETSQVVKYPDGRVLSERISPEGHRESVLRNTLPDGTTETTLHLDNGDIIRTTLSPDGSVERDIQRPDGRAEHTDIGPDGYGTTTVTHSDGTTTVMDQYPDPVLEIDPALAPDDLVPSELLVDQIHPPDADDMPDEPLILEELTPLGFEAPDGAEFDEDGADYASDLEIPVDEASLYADPAEDLFAEQVPVDTPAETFDEPVFEEPFVAVQPMSDAAVE